MPSGFVELDELTNGWQGGQFIVIGARPAMGKTAVALQMLKTAAKHGVPACMYSLEMSDVSLANRLLLSECDISVERFRSGELSEDEVSRIHRAAGVIEKLPVYIDDKPSVTINYIRNHARLMHKREMRLDRGGLRSSRGARLIIPGTVNRKFLTSTAPRRLSPGLNVPFIMLSQLNREAEKGWTKKPMLADLRESGSIEQGADIIASCTGRNITR
ncbi:MAG: DnaB-like helicase C-terminal domain-containing protein [Butyricimonas faecalis]